MSSKNMNKGSKGNDGMRVREWWLGEHLKSNTLDLGLQCAYEGLLDPIYQKLFLDEDRPVARELGHTLSGLVWLHIHLQYELGRQVESSLRGGGGGTLPAGLVDQFLKVIKQKGDVIKMHDYFKDKVGAPTPEQIDLLWSKLRSQEAQSGKEENCDPKQADAA